ncbi:MAG: hypothetical protein RLZZ241_1799 [Bacteroidota bacterium]|jgi:CubicO group peptidase (beta-lactamase class C family)
MKKIKPVLRFFFPVAGILSLIFLVPWTLVRLHLAPLPDTVQEQVNLAPKYNLDGIVVYVAQGNEPPQWYTAGWKDRDKKILADSKAYFKIASISKLYIAAAVAKLIAKGTLHPDSNLATYLPELKDRIANSTSITLRMLVQHRSGIPNFTDQDTYPWDSPPKTNTATLDYVLDKDADFEPDTDYAYSNTNYLLLGEILDRVLGYNHHRYIQENLIQPLGLRHTFSLFSDVDPDSVASGYFEGYPYDIKFNDFINPGGSMVATASDVGTFVGALNKGTLLSPEEQEIYSGLYVYEHTGLVPGYESFASYDAELDAVVVQFVNSSGGISWSVSEGIYNRIFKILKSHKKAEQSKK